MRDHLTGFRVCTVARTSGILLTGPRAFRRGYSLSRAEGARVGALSLAFGPVQPRDVPELPPGSSASVGSARRGMGVAPYPSDSSAVRLGLRVVTILTRRVSFRRRPSSSCSSPRASHTSRCSLCTTGIRGPLVRQAHQANRKQGPRRWCLRECRARVEPAMSRCQCGHLVRP